MTIKEQIVSIIQRQGYDIMTACELASNCIAEFKQSDKKSQTFFVKKASFTLSQKD